MTTRIVLEETGFGIRAAVLVDDRLIEVRDSDRDDPRITDALFAARVTAVDVKLNAAFLDCGLPQPGWLVAKDARAAAGSAERRPIRELVHEGQRLLVQGVREPIEDKGGRFTSDIKLFGYALVHTPLSAAQDLAPQQGPRQGNALRERGRLLFPDGKFVLRRHAIGLAEKVLRSEAEWLAARWPRVETAAKNAKPGRLADQDSLLERLLRGLIELAPASIAAAERFLLLELERLLATLPTSEPVALIRLDADQPAFGQTEVDTALDLALGTEVPLAGGGRLLIQPTAACVAIDVDGGGRAPLDVDLAAATEIARQVRLRNLGGTIIVDFVDLPTRPERQRLEEALRKAFRDDPTPVEIHPVSSLGIVQISRARRGQPLASLFQVPCSCCSGGGLQPSGRALAEPLFAALQSARHPILGIRMVANLRAYLMETGAAGWRRTIERLGYEPRLTIDPSLHRAGFTIDEATHGR
jgi:ribonuclease G